jgi:phosphoserine phosphatase RsbU/P
MSSMPTESGMTTARPAGGLQRAASGPAQLSLFRSPLAARRSPDVHAISIPARAFTGDVYFVHRSDDRMWFALGDVAGKGINAAVVMAMIQEKLEEITQYDPSGAMLRLHTFLCPLLPANRFATMVIGCLCDDGTLIIANAGHPAPLIVRAGGEIESIDSTGPVIGVLSGSQWRTAETNLAPGEALVLYSDGVLEAQSAQGEDFGIARLQARLGRASARQTAEEILAAVNAHSGGARSDDLTLVVVRR